MKQTLRFPHGLSIINPTDSTHFLHHMRPQLGQSLTSLGALGSLSACLCPCLLTLNILTPSDSRPKIFLPVASTPQRSLAAHVMWWNQPVVLSSKQTDQLITMPTSGCIRRPRLLILSRLSVFFGLLDPLTRTNRGSPSCTTVLFGSARGPR